MITANLGFIEDNKVGCEEKEIENYCRLTANLSKIGDSRKQNIYNKTKPITKKCTTELQTLLSFMEAAENLRPRKLE